MYNTPNEKYYLTFSPSPTIYPHSNKQLSSLEIHISLIHIHIKKNTFKATENHYHKHIMEIYSIRLRNNRIYLNIYIYINYNYTHTPRYIDILTYTYIHICTCIKHICFVYVFSRYSLIYI